jgi:hypothetical protein
LLEKGADLCTATGPVGGGDNLRSVRKCEWVRQRRIAVG